MSDRAEINEVDQDPELQRAIERSLWEQQVQKAMEYVQENDQELRNARAGLEDALSVMRHQCGALQASARLHAVTSQEDIDLQLAIRASLSDQ